MKPQHRGQAPIGLVILVAAVLTDGCSPREGGGDKATTSPSTSAEEAASALSGVYRWTLTKEDALAHGLPQDKTPDALAQLPTVGTRILKDGTWVGDPGLDRGDHGTYTVDGDRLAFRGSDNSRVLTFTFSADDKGDLTLTPVLPMNLEDAFIWSTEPWTKIQ